MDVSFYLFNHHFMDIWVVSALGLNEGCLQSEDQQPALSSLTAGSKPWCPMVCSCQAPVSASCCPATIFPLGVCLHVVLSLCVCPCAFSQSTSHVILRAHLMPPECTSQSDWQ